MADDKTIEKIPDRKKVGDLPKTKVEKLEGWSDYKDTIQPLTDARKASEDAKDDIRSVLRSRLVKAGRLKQEDVVDFTVEKDGSISIFHVLKKKERTKSEDLSGIF